MNSFCNLLTGHSFSLYLPFLHSETMTFLKPTDFQLSWWKAILSKIISLSFFFLNWVLGLYLDFLVNKITLTWNEETSVLLIFQNLFICMCFYETVTEIKYCSFEIWHWILFIRLWGESGYSVLLPLWGELYLLDHVP